MHSGFLTPAKADKFKSLINDYYPSKNTIEVFKQSNFAVIAGPAVSGKDTLRERLLADYSDSYQKVLSTTTRSKRANEADTYRFVEEQEMIDLAVQKKLLQIALIHDQQVSATDVSQIENISPNKIGLSILIIQAEQELYKLKPDMRTIFMVPPGYEALVERIRRDRVFDDEELSRRLASARKEINTALETERYYLLVSDIRENVKIQADKFIRFGKRDKTEEIRARKTCNLILDKLG